MENGGWRGASSFHPPSSIFHLRFLSLGRYASKGNRDSVPGVDGDDGEVEVDQFLFGELGADALVDVVGDVAVGDEGDGLGPFHGGAFAIGVEGAFAPGGQAVEALFGLAGGAGVVGVHVNAVGAAV